MDLFRILKEGTKAIPSVKYAIGIAAIVAVVDLIISLKIDLVIAIWGTMLLFIGMVILLTFAKLSEASNNIFALPAKVMMWFCIILFIAVCAMLTSSVFFRRPIDLQYMIIKNQNVDSFSKNNNKHLLAPGNDVKVNYMRLFGAMEVPYLIFLIDKNGSNFYARSHEASDRYFYRKNGDIQLSKEVVSFYRHNWDFKNIIPLQTRMWERYFHANTSAQLFTSGQKIYYSGLRPTIRDLASFGFSISDDWEGHMDENVYNAIADELVPYWKDKDHYDAAHYPPIEEPTIKNLKISTGLKSTDVGFLFVIFTNSAKSSLYDLTLSYFEYNNIIQIPPTDVEKLYHWWKNKKDPDLLGLTDDTIKLINIKYSESQTSSRRRLIDSIRLAELKPNQSVLWILGIYKKDKNDLPKNYLGNVIAPQKVSYTLENHRLIEKIRKPYGLKAARMSIPQGWVGQ